MSSKEDDNITVRKPKKVVKRKRSDDGSGEEEKTAVQAKKAKPKIVEEESFTLTKGKKEKTVYDISNAPPPTELLFIKKERILCSTIKQDFAHLDPAMLLALASKN
jgi:hypothetical protein